MRPMTEMSFVDLAVNALCQSMETCKLSLNQQGALTAQFRFELEYALFGEVEPEAVEEPDTRTVRYSVPVP